jgi:hypothetical protein
VVALPKLGKAIQLNGVRRFSRAAAKTLADAKT